MIAESKATTTITNHEGNLLPYSNPECMILLELWAAQDSSLDRLACAAERQSAFCREILVSSQE